MRRRHLQLLAEGQRTAGTAHAVTVPRCYAVYTPLELSVNRSLAMFRTRCPLTFDYAVDRYV